MTFLETTRLRLIDYSLTLFDKIKLIYEDKQVVKYTLQNRRRNEREIKDIINAEIECYEKFNRTRGKWLVQEKLSGEIIGYVGLLFIRELNKTELTYVLMEKYTGKGYATEAANALKKYAGEVIGYEEVIALIELGNAPSESVAKRVGMLPCAQVNLRGYTFKMFSITLK